MKLPPARNNNIIVQDLNNELLVYDLLTNKAYCLNETSSIVYNACGNNLAFDDLKRKHNFTDDLIYFALDELKANNLLEDYGSGYFGNLSRREIVKRVGLATMIALPVITGLLAPRAAQAGSGTCVVPGGSPAGTVLYGCSSVRYGLCQAGCVGSPVGRGTCCSNTAEIDPRTCPPGTDVNQTGCTCRCA